MVELNEIKERAKAFEEYIKKSDRGDPEIIVEVTKLAHAARQDIPRLCEALEYLLNRPSVYDDDIEQILSGTTEEGKGADG